MFIVCVKLRATSLPLSIAPILPSSLKDCSVPHLASVQLPSSLSLIEFTLASDAKLYFNGRILGFTRLSLLSAKGVVLLVWIVTFLSIYFKDSTLPVLLQVFNLILLNVLIPSLIVLSGTLYLIMAVMLILFSSFVIFIPICIDVFAMRDV